MNKALEELEQLKELVEQLNKSGVDESIDYEKILGDMSPPQHESKFTITTKFTNTSNNPDPEYSKKGDSGFDIRAYVENPVTLKPLERKLIPTGLKFELPFNTELQVRPRSGMALKHGISVLNTPGTVDEGYRGEVGIISVNLSNEEYTIQPGERIAQGVICNVIGQKISSLIKTSTLNESERGSSGFGSTGKE